MPSFQREGGHTWENASQRRAWSSDYLYPVSPRQHDSGDVFYLIIGQVRPHIYTPHWQHADAPYPIMSTDTIIFRNRCVVSRALMSLQLLRHLGPPGLVTSLTTTNSCPITAVGSVPIMRSKEKEKKKRAAPHWNVLVDTIVYRQTSTGCVSAQLLVDSFVDARNWRFATGGGDWICLQLCRHSASAFGWLTSANRPFQATELTDCSTL